MTSTFEGETESDMEDIKTLVSTKLKAHVDAGYSGIGAEFSAKRMKAEGKLTKNFDEKVEDKIRVVRKQYGGRPITKQFTEDDWVNNLRVESTDWVVTDRGDSRPSDHVGVWDLLPKDLSGIHDILYDFFSTFFYRNRISRIMNIGNNLESIGNALKDIEITTQRRCTTDGVTKEWLQLLQDDGNISQFLLTPDRHLPSLTTAGLEEIADTLDKLLGYVGANDFQNKRKISQLNADIKDRTQTR